MCLMVSFSFVSKKALTDPEFKNGGVPNWKTYVKNDDQAAMAKGTNGCHLGEGVKVASAKYPVLDGMYEKGVDRGGNGNPTPQEYVRNRGGPNESKVHI